MFCCPGKFRQLIKVIHLVEFEPILDDLGREGGDTWFAVVGYFSSESLVQIENDY